MGSQSRPPTTLTVLGPDGFAAGKKKQQSHQIISEGGGGGGGIGDDRQITAVVADFFCICHHPSLQISIAMWPKKGYEEKEEAIIRFDHFFAILQSHRGFFLLLCGMSLAGEIWVRVASSSISGVELGLGIILLLCLCTDGRMCHGGMK